MIDPLRTAAPLLPVLLTAAAAAQDSLPFPVTLVGQGELPEVLELQPDPTVLEALTGVDEVRLTGVPMPVGYVAALALERIDFDPREAGVYVDGVRTDFDPGDLTLWKGTVEGADGSDVFLAFSSYGTYGWIHDGIDYTHVSSFPAEDGWRNPRARMYTDRSLIAAGHEDLEHVPCMARTVEGGAAPTVPDDLFDVSPHDPAVLLECKMAIETDRQLYTVWKDLQAEQTYVFALLGAVSDRYETQVEVKLTFPYVQFNTRKNDGWTSQDNGGGCGDLLNEFRNAWGGNIPNGAHLAHFISGASLGCGVAYLDVLCSQNNGFAVSCCINGGVTFPVTQGANTWDFVVFAHETGHNFGTPHTHDYCPPLDKCSDNCQGNTQCTNQGTVMSYCHLCGGGMNNITTFFHPTVVTLMRNEADGSCLPNHDGTPPTRIFSDDFESGDLTAGGWSPVTATVHAAAAHEGSWGARIRKKGKLERRVSTAGYGDVTLSLWRKTNNYDAGEDFKIRWYDGSTWRTLEKTTKKSWGFVSWDLPPGADDNPSFAIRLKSSKADEFKERADVDEVMVLGVPLP